MPRAIVLSYNHAGSVRGLQPRRQAARFRVPAMQTASTPTPGPQVQAIAGGFWPFFQLWLLLAVPALDSTNTRTKKEI